MDDNRCCRFPYSFHLWLRVRSHPLPTFPLLRLDLVASVYTLCSDLDIDHAADTATGIKNALWHMARGSVQRLAGKSGERLLQWRCLCVPWRHRSSPCIGMCRVLGDGRAVMRTADTAAGAATQPRPRSHWHPLDSDDPRRRCLGGDAPTPAFRLSDSWLRLSGRRAWLWV